MVNRGTQFAQNNIMASIDRTPFWDSMATGNPYSKLNLVEVPGREEIRRFQIESLKQYEETVLQGKVADLNNIILQNDYNSLISMFESEENQVLSQAITNIVQAANGLYYVSEKTKAESAWKGLQTKLQKLYSALETAKVQLQINDNTILETYIDQVKTALADCQVHNATSAAELSKRINLFKGDLVEDLGVLWLNSLKVPNIKTIRLGNVNLNTKQDNRHGGQLLQDIISFSMSSPDVLKSTIIEYKPVGSETYEKRTLEQFIYDLENPPSGQSKKQIVLSDAGYDALLGLNGIAIQAKSGFKQKLWNQAKYNRFSIENLSPQDRLALSVKETFTLLNSLDQEEDISVKNTSEDYNALMNYGIGTILGQILHLNQTEGNQYVLTPQGFTTFSKRLENLLETNDYIVSTKEDVSVHGDALTRQYSADMK